MNKESKSHFFNDPQNIIAVGVTIISLCALIVSVIQTRVLKEEREVLHENARASVWPRLGFDISRSHDPADESLVHFTLSLSNSGVGPAIITDVRVSYKGKAAMNWWKLFEIQEIPDSISTSMYSATINNEVIKIGETVKILDFDNNLPLGNAFIRRVADVTIEVYYESIYGEIWKCEYTPLVKETTVKLENFEGLPEEEQFTY